ncbi:ATP-grasp domain-containing protein [Rhodanobacter sp. L36]|uniref:ATP-grasp domain-containing protein n=1 Tax=Rhodanobacter sp. L36 TaxID=1747221 RepID=UPI00131CDED4|nr:ATP-grasp domain-containing protein [Rhodanobacter sp. L36]
MLLLEHDAKELARQRGIPVPAGIFVDSQSVESMQLENDVAWVVKAQVGVGGRGKAGGVGFANSTREVVDFVRTHADASIKGQRIAGFRVERKVFFVHEVYLGFMVDAERRGVRVLLCAQGGVDVEENAQQHDAMLTAIAAPDEASLIAAASQLLAQLPSSFHGPLAPAIAALASAFVAFDATLLEVNPLFVLADGSWIAGDMKLAPDENAFPRQPELERVVRARPDVYREANFKLDHDFDYVEIDRRGQVGLLTTGAGLSMMLIDEMLQANRRPFNFCDVRTGLLRGSPTRLIEVLKQFKNGPEISVVLVNIFAGITDLGEFAQLLLQALDAVPEITVPVVARLIGNNVDAAKTLIAQSGRPITVEMDLDKALKLAIDRAGVVA